MDKKLLFLFVKMAVFFDFQASQSQDIRSSFVRDIIIAKYGIPSDFSQDELPELYSAATDHFGSFSLASTPTRVNSSLEQQAFNPNASNPEEQNIQHVEYMYMFIRCCGSFLVLETTNFERKDCCNWCCCCCSETTKEYCFSCCCM